MLTPSQAVSDEHVKLLVAVTGADSREAAVRGGNHTRGGMAGVLVLGLVSAVLAVAAIAFVSPGGAQPTLLRGGADAALERMAVEQEVEAPSASGSKELEEAAPSASGKMTALSFLEATAQLVKQAAAEGRRSKRNTSRELPAEAKNQTQTTSTAEDTQSKMTTTTTRFSSTQSSSTTSSDAAVGAVSTSQATTSSDAAVGAVTTSQGSQDAEKHSSASDDGRPPITFYMYRAGSADSYPLENVNAADLAGVMWYLHNEVIVSTPRKYKIDRIRRYKVSIKNSQEFWNVHHRNFGAFMAFDAARCTTPICGDIFSQYGFIVGCQVLPTRIMPYLGNYKTRVTGGCEKPFCNAPVWYALPGPCPTHGLSNDQIAGNSGAQDVMQGKSAQCLKQQPGGRCEEATGAPDCTYSYKEAGHIMLDDLAGIEHYNHWWNASYTECVKETTAGTRTGPCLHNKEFDVQKDHGVGCSFWDGKADLKNSSRRIQAVRDLFGKRFPDMPADLEEPPCDFDMYYDGETDWPINHTGAVEPTAGGFTWEAAKSLKRKKRKAPQHHPAAAAGKGAESKGRETCKSVGCGKRGQHCDCNEKCKQYHDCCEDYKQECSLGHDSAKSSPFHNSSGASTKGQGRQQKEPPQKELPHKEPPQKEPPQHEKQQQPQQQEKQEQQKKQEKQEKQKEEQQQQQQQQAKPQEPKEEPKEVAVKSLAQSSPEVAKATKACQKADEECKTAVDWAMAHGVYEHPEWYHGLKGTSARPDFEKQLAHEGQGSCDKVCKDDVLVVRKLL